MPWGPLTPEQKKERERKRAIYIRKKIKELGGGETGLKLFNASKNANRNVTQETIDAHARRQREYVQRQKEADDKRSNNGVEMVKRRSNWASRDARFIAENGGGEEGRKALNRLKHSKRKEREGCWKRPREYETLKKQRQRKRKKEREQEEQQEQQQHPPQLPPQPHSAADSYLDHQSASTEVQAKVQGREEEESADGASGAAGAATEHSSDESCPICLGPLAPLHRGEQWPSHQQGAFPCGHRTCVPCFGEYVAHTAHDPMATGAGTARRTRSGVRVQCPLCRQSSKVQIS